MKNLLIAALTLCSVTALAQTYKVDTSKTTINWVGKKVAGQHSGIVSAKAGNLVFKENDLVGGEIVVDMNSIKCTDITDAETNGKFLGHIKSPDFFDTAKFSEAKIVIKSVKKAAKGFDVTADLTIKGATAPITFNAEITKTEKNASTRAKIVFDRTKYDIRYSSGKFFKDLGDKVIYDDVELTVDVTATK